MTPHDAPKSVAEMMTDIMGNVGNLVRNEVALARAEMSESLVKVAGALGTMAVAFLLAMTGLNVLTASLIAAAIRFGVGRIAKHHPRDVPLHQKGKDLRVQCIPTNKPVGAKLPDIAKKHSPQREVGHDVKPVIRCAIYTRKSSDEGLDQSFNSLDAQHEACAAYIASQRHEGWKLAPDRFDYGGLSGGNLDRPALQRLLAEIDAGRIGMIVVYKIDRLNRSLADFGRLVERLDAKGCSFVSVTQAFNTATSMGRLTLNVLLSFAQFEREVTAERIRDKIAASKKKGLWMGGTLPLGYDSHPDPQRRELVVNPIEAAAVVELFTLYERLGNLRLVEEEATRRGLRSKALASPSGRRSGGFPFTRGQLHYLLTNPVYIGRIRHKDQSYPGLHPAIIDAALWDRVQANPTPAGRQTSFAAPPR